MDTFQQLYCDLVCLHDKVHTYHIRTVNKEWCATIHSTLGTIYQWLEENVDSFGENIITKYMWDTVSSTQECYDNSGFIVADSIDPEEIIEELYDDVDVMETRLGEALNKANNQLAQLMWPIREDFTDYCAALKKEMKWIEKETDKD